MKNWNKQELKTLVKNYPNTQNSTLAEMLGRTEKSVQWKASELGLEKSAEHLRISRAEFTRHYTVREDFFDSIDTEEKAYWLGFMYADAYVDQRGVLSLGLSIVDKEQLIRLRKTLFIGKHPDLIERSDVDGILVLNICSAALCERLLSLGMRDKMYMPKIDGDLKNHFIRGLHDGDGCISWLPTKYGVRKPRWALCGEKPLLGQVQSTLMKNCEFNETKISFHGGIHYLHYGGALQVERLMEYMYRESTLFLSRKYNNYFGKIKEMTKN